MAHCEVSPIRWTALAASLFRPGRPELWRDPAAVPVHSGRAGLNHVFSYLRLSGVLKDKNSRILTPPWLGHEVYGALRPHGFPVLDQDPDIRVALVYHQYGFPQDLDEIQDACSRRGMVFVEDCAHALEGRFKGRRLGLAGVAGIFSLSKFFPTPLGGAVLSQDPSLRAHVAARDAAGNRIMGGLTFCAKLALGNSRDRETSIAGRLNELACAGYPFSRRVSWAGRLCALPTVREELDRRRRNYRLYRELLPGIEELQALEADATPYVVPLMHPHRGALERLVSALRRAGFETGIYAFDANRNLFKPRYVPCVRLPVHGGIDEQAVELVAKSVRAAL